ncbi:protein-L-isoaspartate(D-aspartate) O-methyltransferase [Permianibacter sp. IMCC34836]|uniref:protein-L-isoaspartate(D-aspartate) O-methyltransferase n=1 Tax=Permianibacter fluminis TaxID=2738515 RepID=UPI00155668AD|nr:protein-L-isoaspartate(D-aspartate) O-methyltransferase [Permianibacter fluminis]NQD37085.1 protein-L-isoaspartate(D-aspartate) O-methyltransferase [Permianibacter fluminis]
MNGSNLRGIGMTSDRTRTRLVQRLQEEGIRNTMVLAVMAGVPRHIFVDEGIAHRAYEDTALPIGRGQTISQPFIVAKMTEILLDAGPLKNVLEIGTGCGYQTAVLAQLVEQVYTIERIDELQQQAQARLSALQLDNIEYRHGDGFQGWKEKGPFDGIIVTAAPLAIPPALVAQLADGGRLVVPVGQANGSQNLMLIEKRGDQLQSAIMDKVRFVPLQPGPTE